MCKSRKNVCGLEDFQWCEEPYFASAAVSFDGFSL
jgi:hypothetical protein